MCQSELILGNKIFDQITATEWDSLVEKSMTNTPFQRYAYQKAWWTHLGHGELVSVVVRDETDVLIGLAPFFIDDGRLQFNGTKEETDYLDLISPAEYAEKVWDAVFASICDDEACPNWDVLDCYNIPTESKSRQILPRLATDRGFVFSEDVAEVCPVISLKGTFDDYLGAIDKKQRHEIRRKMRRAIGAEVELEIIRDPSELTEAVNTFLDLLQKSTPEKNSWLNAPRTAVFHEVARASLADGTLLLMFVTVAGQRLAALFNFEYEQRIWVYNSGIDISRYGNLSLGVVLTSYAIEYALKQGCHMFDFLRGDETYKYRFGAADTTIYRLQLAKRE